jgi:hypothetical protein|tara:strand:- start:393 stop:590 length:198 start_codon:yes stop_codon:yes gene_type:complete
MTTDLDQLEMNDELNLTRVSIPENADDDMRYYLFREIVEVVDDITLTEQALELEYTDGSLILRRC